MTPEREAVTEGRLLEILNTELAVHDECRDCAFTGTVRRLSEPYPDGGNWARSLIVKGRPRDPNAAGAVAADVVAAVAARYNLS